MPQALSACPIDIKIKVSSSSSVSVCTVNIYQVDLVHIDTPLLFVPLFSLVLTISSASSLACTVNISGRFGTYSYRSMTYEVPSADHLIPTLSFTYENKNLSVFLTAKLIPTFSLSLFLFLC